MKYVAYHRTSTSDQHLDRGITEIVKYCADNSIELYKNKVYTDQQTGKNFNRPRYQMLKEEILESGDTLIITELDRLGRNKDATLKELRFYQDNNIRVMVLELPTVIRQIKCGLLPQIKNNFLRYAEALQSVLFATISAHCFM